MRPYHRRRIGRYFTVYFVPVFQIEKLAEWLQCEVCQNVYPVDILQHKPPPNPERILNEVRTDLNAGMSAQKVQVKLLNSGLRQDLAQRVIDEVMSDHRLACANCGSEYLDSATFCSQCGMKLH